MRCLVGKRDFLNMLFTYVGCLLQTQYLGLKYSLKAKSPLAQISKRIPEILKMSLTG